MNTAAKNRAKLSETPVLPSHYYERPCPEPSERASDQELDLYDRHRDRGRMVDEDDR